MTKKREKLQHFGLENLSRFEARSNKKGVKTSYKNEKRQSTNAIKFLDCKIHDIGNNSRYRFPAIKKDPTKQRQTKILKENPQTVTTDPSIQKNLQNG